MKAERLEQTERAGDFLLEPSQERRNSVGAPAPVARELKRVKVREEATAPDMRVVASASEGATSPRVAAPRRRSPR